MLTLRKFVLTGALLVAGLFVITSMPQSAEAAGYKVFRSADVVHVAYWDRLNMRRWPASHSRVVWSIPSHARNVWVKRCKIKRYGSDWCKVMWRGRVGWVNSRFLDIR